MKWWDHKTGISYALWPLSLLWQLSMKLRQCLYHYGVFNVTRFDIPIIVVGNLTVGGNGKTPMIIALATLLQQMGFKPAIVSRGYGGSLKKGTCHVHADSDASIVGDEPLLLAQRLRCPIVIGRRRVEAVKAVLAQGDCDVILSDDGLQHLAMGRTMEIIVVDGERQFGNGFCLPAGPLRESRQRLHTTPWVIYHSQNEQYPLRFFLQPQLFRSLKDTTMTKPLMAFAHQTIAVIAAIGYPQRFLKTLQDLKMNIKAQLFRDHHCYTAEELAVYQHTTLMMTEKDAVKCRQFLLQDAWYLEVDAVLSAELQQQLSAAFVKWQKKT